MDILATNILGKLFGRFPELLPEITEITHDLLEREKEKTQIYVDGIIDSECGYLFTNDYSYLTKRAKVMKVRFSLYLFNMGKGR